MADSLFQFPHEEPVAKLRDYIARRFRNSYHVDLGTLAVIEGSFKERPLYEPEKEAVAALAALEAEVMRLRQGLWDVATLTGMDTDGDETPDHMVYPDIVELAMREVRQLRQDYETVEGNAWPRG